MVSVTDDDGVFSHTGSLQFVERERIEARWRATTSGIRLKFHIPDLVLISGHVIRLRGLGATRRGSGAWTMVGKGGCGSAGRSCRPVVKRSCVLANTTRSPRGHYQT